MLFIRNSKMTVELQPQKYSSKKKTNLTLPIFVQHGPSSPLVNWCHFTVRILYLYSSYIRFNNSNFKVYCSKTTPNLLI